MLKIDDFPSKRLPETTNAYPEGPSGGTLLGPANPLPSLRPNSAIGVENAVAGEKAIDYWDALNDC